MDSGGEAGLNHLRIQRFPAWPVARAEPGGTVLFAWKASVDWQDEGIVLGVRAHGEGGGIVEVLTERHGRHLGLVHGMRTRRGGRLQPGDTVRASWRARLADHLGHFSVEVTRTRAAAVLDDGLRLAGLQAVLAVSATTLPEREPHPAVCAALAPRPDVGGGRARL